MDEEETASMALLLCFGLAWLCFGLGLLYG
jgi:hypothetical protein